MSLQDYQGLCDVISKPKIRSNASCAPKKVCSNYLYLIVLIQLNNVQVETDNTQNTCIVLVFSDLQVFVSSQFSKPMFFVEFSN